ncbi:MAG: hypothetical protein CBD97_01650 [Pelagibacteraceae bacterium TMED237]|nr:MAG: hypothetical protein CBD97_01650 [Pelagibacteraceae bacterium TMED237]|tara:strand:- start:20029 stop:20994 length:966 start_codon:yes stop_codon:yes gene_type:complete
MKINYLDLFSGVGGFTLGLQNSGFKFHYHGFSEIDKYAIETYKRRFTNAEELGTITDIDPGKLPNIDLITFGFPCQDLSIAGKRKGLEGGRSGLFFEAMRIIRAKEPKYIIFENVKGLFSSNGGEDFKVCLKEIADIGYDGQWELLNTRWFLPQNRQRVYFVGHLRGNSRPKIFPFTENGRKNTENRGENKIQISCAPSREYGWKDVSPTLCARDYKDPKLVKSSGLKQIGVIDKDSEATRVYDPSGTARTIKDGGGMGAKTGLYDVGGIRRLTPLECERLQGFPDNWTEGQSDTQRYRQMGNAVSVPVVQAIAERLIKGF